MVAGRFSRVHKNRWTDDRSKNISELTIWLFIFFVHNDQKMKIYSLVNVRRGFKSNTIKQCHASINF